MYFFVIIFILVTIVTTTIFGHEAGFRFEERTSTGCVDGNGVPITGYRRDDLSLEKCVTECKKRQWCRGIGVSSNINSHCSLLTNESSPLDGWTYIDYGKWAEPKDWKEGLQLYPNLRCLEKVEIRCKSRITDGNCKLIGSECWCNFESSLSKPYGAAVCGYPPEYRGAYYSLSLNSSHSPLTIIKALDKKPHPDACKKDNYCLGNLRSNYCFPSGCTGFKSELGSDLERWKDKSSSIFRCVNMEANWHECGRAKTNGDYKFWKKFTRNRVVGNCPTNKPLRFECGDFNGPKYTSKMIPAMDLMSNERINFESGSLWQDSTYKKSIIHTISTDPSCGNKCDYDFWLHFTIQGFCAGLLNLQEKSGWWFSVSYFGGNQNESSKYFALGNNNTCVDFGYESVDNEGGCRAAAKSLDKSFGKSKKYSGNHPKGCFIDYYDKVNFNKNEYDRRNISIRPVCKYSVSDDDVTDDTGIDRTGRTDDDKTPSGNSGTKTTVSTLTDTNRTISGSSITQSIIMTGSIDSTSSIATPSENDMYASSKEELVTRLPDDTMDPDESIEEKTASGMMVGIIIAVLLGSAFCVFTILVMKHKKNSNFNKKQHENKVVRDDKASDNLSDPAYENFDVMNQMQPKVNNDNVNENPHYEARSISKNERNRRLRTDAVDLEDIEIVTAIENIYYDI